jgi:transcriptional regulator with XRE-family HTH domain
MSEFVTNLKYLLSQSEKLQKDICKEIGISKQKLTNWKTGYTEPNLDDIAKIALYFNVSTDYLIGIEDELGIKKENEDNAFIAFNKEEIEIIEDYRTLTPDLRKMIRETLKTFTTSEENKKYKRG